MNFCSVFVKIWFCKFLRYFIRTLYFVGKHTCFLETIKEFVVPAIDVH